MLIVIPIDFDIPVLLKKGVFEKTVKSEEPVIKTGEDVVKVIGGLLGHLLIVRVLRLESDDLIGSSEDRHEGRKDSFHGILNLGRDNLRTTLDLVPVRLAIVILKGFTALLGK